MNSAQRSNDLYDLLAPEVREDLARHAVAKTVPAATLLITHGVSPRSLVILDAGSVEVSLCAGKMAFSTVISGRGQVFGLREVLSQAPPDADVVCRTECQVTFLPGQQFKAIVEQHPEIYAAVARILSTEVRMANDLRRCSRRNPAH